MEKYLRITAMLITGLLIYSCSPGENRDSDPSLFKGFKDPPAEARPFVRWWWNGNVLEKSEIVAQLDALKRAGIGGVEINPIAMPEEANKTKTEALTWLSNEWNDMLGFASEEAKKRGMITDLIVGSGWPFGGEFLNEDETIQKIIVHRIPCSGNQHIHYNTDSLYIKAVSALSRSHGIAKSFELKFVRLVPVDIQKTSQIIDLKDDINLANQLDFTVPAGNYDLVYGFLQKGNREVMYGAPGAAGPVMNHYEKEISRAYLSRLNKISEDTGIPLSELIRALFCDSIELDGSNWTDGFEALFFKSYQYRLEPWLPFIFYDPFNGYSNEKYDEKFLEKLKRVRYDYNRLLVDTFLKNFTEEFQKFCSDKGVLCRYQAYGLPFLMGMMEGNMIPDIPESNSWIYTIDMDSTEWHWNQGHGYMVWNLYAASGGHLKDRKIISTESMTNTRGVFKTSLNEIKQHDDMNFITGMNHSVLHGYNYSPPAAGFPGWIRFGTYFSEKNTWWPYFSKWVDYNARLSYVFQKSDPVKSIAVVAPEADIWANNGLTRTHFQTDPWYCYRLWEPISQAGSSCDYISQKIIQQGTKNNGKLIYGPMSYEVIILCNVRSVDPETAIALLDFIKSGGKLVVIDRVPDRSLSFQEASKNDSIVNGVISQIKNDYSKLFFRYDRPDSEDHLLSWTMTLLEDIDIKKDVIFDKPYKNVFQMRKQYGDKDLFFIVNSSASKSTTLKATFPTGNKRPWLWNPEDGTRKAYPYKNNRKNTLDIDLNPLQSILLVFDADSEVKLAEKPLKSPGKEVSTVKSTWVLTFEHINGQQFTKYFENLNEFGTSADTRLSNFAGTVFYKTTFILEEDASWLQLGVVNKGVTEVILNGKKLGVNWYGKPIFPINSALNKGENNLEIKYTTVLSNYVMSLEDSPTAKRWTQGFEKIPLGLEGNVSLYD